MSDKWIRKYSLEIEGADGLIHIISDNPYLLTLEFSITRNDLTSANDGKFRIYNLSQETRDAIFKDYIKPSVFRSIVLRAGYATEPVLPIIFNGNLKSVQSYREEGSVNFITEIDAFDFSHVMTNCYSNFNTSDQPNCTRKYVIERLAKDLKYNGTQLPVGAISAFEGEHPRGRAVIGNTWEELRKQTESHCFIDNGSLFCLEDGDCVAGGIEELTSDIMLGTPRRYETQLKAELLFEPRLGVGQKVVINSTSQSRFNGEYKVTGIAHQGVISDAVSGKCRTIVSILLGSYQTI
jgi:hypothetical protein